jgi:fructose-1,6-bisphosphatase/inositol monophosphatase family enzyme
MMENLVRRGEDLARAAQQQKLREIAQQLRAVFGSGAIVTEEAAVLVRGRGLVKRWLVDPSLRFLSKGLQ